MKIFLSLSLATAIFVGLTGCTTVNTIEPAQQAGVRQMVNDKRVITDPSLNSKVNVVGLNVAATPDGLMRLQVEVVNRRSSVQDFFYQVEWFDMNGMLTDTTSGGWKTRQILGKETMTLTAVAPNANCKDFRVKFIENPR